MQPPLRRHALGALRGFLTAELAEIIARGAAAPTRPHYMLSSMTDAAARSLCEGCFEELSDIRMGATDSRAAPRLSWNLREVLCVSRALGAANARTGPGRPSRRIVSEGHHRYPLANHLDDRRPSSVPGFGRLQRVLRNPRTIAA